MFINGKRKCSTSYKYEDGKTLMERAFLGGFAMFEAFFFTSPSIPPKLALAFCPPLFQVRLVSSIIEKSYPCLTLITGIRLIECFWHAEWGPCTTLWQSMIKSFYLCSVSISSESDINNFFGSSSILLFLPCIVLSVRGLPPLWLDQLNSMFCVWKVKIMIR